MHPDEIIVHSFSDGQEDIKRVLVDTDGNVITDDNISYVFVNGVNGRYIYFLSKIEVIHTDLAIESANVEELSESEELTDFLENYKIK